jgi:flavorubredoxin
MPTELYNHDGHLCLMFTDLCDAGGEAVQANQFLIVDNHTGAVIDPGGNLAYSELYLSMTRHFAPSDLTAIIASHADPDIIASLDRWTTATQANVCIFTIS